MNKNNIEKEAPKYTSRLIVRLTPQLHKEIAEYAALCGLTTSAYARKRLEGKYPKQRLTDKEMEALNSLSDARGDIQKLFGFLKGRPLTNLKDSQYVVALHRDSKSGIMRLHIDANRIDMRGNVNDAHYIYERAMAAAAKVGQQRGWKDAQEVSRQNKEAITNDCLSVLAKMPYFDWGLYTKCLTQMGYDVKLQSDSKGQVRGYAIKRGNSIYKSSELGKGRCLMPSKIEGTWAKLHHQELEKPVSTPTKNTQQPKNITVPKPMPTADNTPKIRHFVFYTDEFHHYPVDIPQNCLDVIDKNIALDADNVFAKIGDVQKTAILLFAEYIDAATTIAAQSGGGGGGATSGWGRDKDEDELSWAHRCAMMANRLCRPRKKQGYGR